MKNNTLYFGFFTRLAMLFCFTTQAQQLDMTQYLAAADKDINYPSAEQIKMLETVMPKEKYRPAPAISDRTYWDAIGKSESGKAYLKEALSKFDQKPEVPITDEIYRRANKEGNRGIYKPRYYRTMDRLEHFILAECIENKGRFVPQVVSHSKAILSMKSWLHPNHDDSENGVLEGKRVTIDLGARKFGSVLLLAKILLEDKLDITLTYEIEEQLQWRIIDSYLESCKTNNQNNKWIKSTSNWNSVCTSGSVFVTITTAPNQTERLTAVGSALNSMKYYLSGFGDDGYCSEGLGYWGYGFGHYLYLAQTLHDYTDGNINLFDANNPEKLKNIGNFPEKFEIQNERCAPFSDGVSSISKKGSNFAYALSTKHYGAILPTELRLEEAIEQLMVWADAKSFAFIGDTSKEARELPDYSYFDDFGMVISRGKQETPFSIAIKAGHNAENHNHSDVGTYTIVLDKDIIAGDIGAPSYTAGAFSPDNKARSSWGHPLPLVGNTLQSNGIVFKGVIKTTTFTKTEDKVVIDIKPAYEVAALNSLVRTITNDKTETGSITILDMFSASEPITFGTALMTLSDYEIIDSKTIILNSENQKVKVEVTSDTGTFVIKDEVVPVAHLREGGPAYRIGIDCIEPTTNGSIEINYTPVTH